MQEAEAQIMNARRSLEKREDECESREVQAREMQELADRRYDRAVAMEKKIDERIDERSDWKIRELKHELSQNHKDLNERLKEEYKIKNIELDKESDRLCLGIKAVFGWILTYHFLIIIVTAIQSGVFIKHVMEFLDDTFYAAYCVVMTILELDWLIKIILLVTLVVIGFFMFKWLRLKMKNISGKMRLEDILPIPVVVLITMIYFAEGISSVVSINLCLLYILLIGFYFVTWSILLIKNNANKIYWLHIINVVVLGVILVVWGISAFVDMINVLRC